MRHELVDLGNGSVYIVNIPTLASEGSISKEDAIILNLWERLKEAHGALGKIAHMEIESSGVTAIALSVKYLKDYNDREEE